MTDHVFTHSPVLGTILTVSVAHVAGEAVRSIDDRVLDEIDRLEAMLSRYRSDSALERWKRDDLADSALRTRVRYRSEGRATASGRVRRPRPPLLRQGLDRRSLARGGGRERT